MAHMQIVVTVVFSRLQLTFLFGKKVNLIIQIFGDKFPWGRREWEQRVCVLKGACPQTSVVSDDFPLLADYMNLILVLLLRSPAISLGFTILGEFLCL